jgi:hypothetical protein
MGRLAEYLHRPEVRHGLLVLGAVLVIDYVVTVAQDHHDFAREVLDTIESL